ENELPWLRLPLSHAPVVLVEVWSVPSRLVHWTDEPAWMVRSGGWKAKLSMFTCSGLGLVPHERLETALYTILEICPRVALASGRYSRHPVPQLYPVTTWWHTAVSMYS